MGWVGGGVLPVIHQPHPHPHIHNHSTICMTCTVLSVLRQVYDERFECVCLKKRKTADTKSSYLDLLICWSFSLNLSLLQEQFRVKVPFTLSCCSFTRLYVTVKYQVYVNVSEVSQAPNDTAVSEAVCCVSPSLFTSSVHLQVKRDDLKKYLVTLYYACVLVTCYITVVITINYALCSTLAYMFSN